MNNNNEVSANRRRILATLGLTSAAMVAAPNQWTKPILNAVLLPAHAQTSCSTDTTAGGPLIGHPSGAANCQDACEAEATAQNAQLCAVETTVDSGGATQCSCDLDLP